MKASRELDALVAEHVLGYEVRPECTYSEEIDTVWYRPQGSDLFAADLPHYSMDHTAGWQIYLTVMDMLFSKRKAFYRALHAFAQEKTGHSIAWPDVLTVLRHEAPRYFCLAALEAVGKPTPATERK